MSYTDDPEGGDRPASPKGPAPRGLGRGLSALLGEDVGDHDRAVERARGLKQVSVADLQPGR